MAEHEEHEHDFGLTCVECAGDLGEGPPSRPWYREPRIILLAASAVLTAAGLLLGLTPLPSWASLAILGAAVVLGAVYPAIAAFRSLKEGALTINTLLVVATAGAIALRLWEEAAVLVVVFSLGGVLETYAVDRARRSLGRLVELVPREARTLSSGVETIVPVAMVNVGDTILIKPGDRVPLDGMVTAGVSSLDQSPITGESVPSFKKPGDEVWAGSINQQGSLEVRVTKISQDTTLAKIIHLVEEHQSRKSSYQRFGDRFGRIYTPLMFVAALAVGAIPPLVLSAPFTDWIYRGLVVLVVSCSCGIALSVPVAVVSAIANAARHGVLVKGGAYLELLGSARTFVFDKTGTLTYGEPVVTDIVGVGGVKEDRLLEVAAAIERRSEHPLAAALVRAAGERGLPDRRVSDFHAVPGLGARGKIGAHDYHVGSRKFFEAHSLILNEIGPAGERLENEGKTLVLVGEGVRLLGLVAVADTVREAAPGTIASLSASGVRHIVMLTGDSSITARAIAAKVGLSDYRASLLPEEKADAVAGLMADYGETAMVGDGVNDAPALAAATVGIAMGAAGSDVAVETGDIVLMSDDLAKLPYVFKLSRRTIGTIKFNIAAALILVALLVILALAGRIDLVPGLLVNEIGAFFIILNGLRLLA